MVIKRVSTYIHLQSFSIGNDIGEVIGPGKVKGQIVVFSKLRSFHSSGFRDGVLDYTEFQTLLQSIFHPHNLTEIPEEKLKEFMNSLDSNHVSTITTDYVT